MFRLSTGYSILPPVYDRWQKSYGKDFSALILPRLLQTLRLYHVGPASMVDLGCGTGTMALMLARRGWRVWGVDGSAAMIAEASKKLRSRTSRVALLRQPLTHLRLPERVVLATSLFDTLNHLTTRRALFAAFRRVHSALLPGGYFIFDLNNELCFKTLWTQTDAIDHRDFTLILRNIYNPEKGSAASHVTLFVREGDRFRCERETVRERYYADVEVTALLQKAGFLVRETVPFNFSSLPHIGKLKTWWVAQRGPGEPGRDG